MKTIVISITVPDGANVRVEGAGQGGGQQRQERPFVPRPDPEEPDEPCPVHGTGWRLVPGGYSEKKQKRYNSFWVCQTKGCDMRPGQEPNFPTEYSGGTEYSGDYVEDTSEELFP